MAKFNVSKVRSVSVGRLEFKQTVGEHLDAMQEKFRADLVAEGYSAEQAEKIVDAVLKQVFGLLSGSNASDDSEAKAE